MNIKELQSQISLGEDSTRQFKADVRNAASLASEMAAFANAEGGTIFLGVADDGALNLAGLLLFAERPELIKPQFVVKAIRYPGDEIHVTDYVDTEDFAGPLPKIFYVAKGLLPYHGLGSGIKRALAAWPQIDFADDRDGCLFTATVHRKPAEKWEPVNIASESSPKNSPKTQEQILDLMRQNVSITTEEIGSALGITKRAVLKQVEKLKGQGRLRRIGPARGGHWEVMS